MKTVVALYDDIIDARAAVEDLVDDGIPRNDISLIARDVDEEYGRYVDRDYDDYEEDDTVGEAAAVGATGGALIGGLAGVLVGLGAFAIPGIGPVVAAGPIVAGLTGAGIGAVAGGIVGALVGWGIPKEEAEYYAEGLRRGGTLVAVRTSDENVEAVVDTLEDHGPVDVERRAAYWREEHGWTGYDANAGPYDADQISTYRQQRETWEADYDEDDFDYDEDEETFGVAGEELRGGTRRVRGGTTRVRSYVGSGTDLGTFDDYDQDFRRHYESNYATTNYGYEQYRHAYRHGYNLGMDPSYREGDWNSVEPTARRHWEESNEGTWEEFKDAVRHAWQEAKQKVT